MSRKTLWKNITIPNDYETGRLQSYWASSRGAFPKYTFEIHAIGGGGYVETNLPTSELRRLFSYAGVKLPEYVTDTMTTDERYGHEE